MTQPDTTSQAADKPVRSPRGKALSCKGWVQESALRLLMNSLDPEVAERPAELVAFGGPAGKPVSDRASLQTLTPILRELGDDQTLTVKAGKAAGVTNPISEPGVRGAHPPQFVPTRIRIPEECERTPALSIT